MDRNQRTIDLRFPLGGTNKRAAFQQQPPFSTADALNVRPVDALKQRQRGGSRPGVGKSHYTQLGSGNPIRNINAVTVAQTDGLDFWTDNFDSPSLGSVWSAASWISASTPAILPDNVASVTYGNEAGAVRSALSALDTTQLYVLEMFIQPYNGSHQGNYQIFLRMDNTTPVATTAGVVVELVMPDDDGTYSGTLKYYTGSTLTTSVLFTNGTTTNPQAGWFRVYVNGNDITVYWLENQVLTATTVGAAAGARFGFGMHATQAAGICLCDTFRVQYKTSNSNQAFRRLLVATSNGLLYREKELNTFEAVSSSLTLGSDYLLQSAERFQKLYYADYGRPRVVGTDGVISGGVLDAASVSNWTTKSISTNDDAVEITSVVGGTFVDGTYRISTIHATNGLTLLDMDGVAVTASCTTCTFRVARVPKIYDPVANTLTAWWTTEGGYIPLECPLICNYRDRMVLAGPPSAPHAWFMSRQGDPLDFDYGSETTEGAAVAGVNTESGFLGEPIKALIPGGDDWLIFGCENSIAVLRGDPTAFGEINYVSRTIGVVDKQAWCKGPSNEIIFLSRDGLYVMPAGGGNPTPISRERLPDELLRIDSNIFTVQLHYDVQDRGVHIFLTPENATGQYHWWFDWETKSFWQFNLPANYEPTASMYFAASCASDTAVLLGCRDGYVRRFRNAHERDEQTAFSSYVDYGPFKLGDDYHEGILKELFAVVAAGSGDVSFAQYTGDSHESAQAATTAFASGTWSSTGRSYKERRRMRGAAAKVRISNGETGRAWAIEKLTAVLMKGGAQ